MREDGYKSPDWSEVKMNRSDFDQILTVEPCKYWWVRYTEFCKHPDYDPPIPTSRCPYLYNQSKCPHYESDIDG